MLPVSNKTYAACLARSSDWRIASKSPVFDVQNQQTPLIRSPGIDPTSDATCVCETLSLVTSRARRHPRAWLSLEEPTPYASPIALPRTLPAPFPRSSHLRVFELARNPLLQKTEPQGRCLP